MDRLACVDLPALPLQLLCKRHPDWTRFPVAVVDHDKAGGTILWVNENARAHFILPGQRYAYGLSLSSQLRAGIVSTDEIEQGISDVIETLRSFSPDVEPDADEPGVFWLNAAGLGNLVRSLRSWARTIQHALKQSSFSSTVIVGFSRFSSYAIARQTPLATAVFDSANDERDTMRRVLLSRLGIRPALRDALGRLGITTLGAFLRLPPGGLLARFGPAAHRLHQLAAQERWDPLQPSPHAEPLERKVILDDPEQDIDRLVFAIKRGLHPLLALLARHKTALATLFIELTLDHQGSPRLDVIRPAEPTLDARILLRLVYLRLEASPPQAGVTDIAVSAEESAATREQLDLFAQKSRRDLGAANEALARLRAELGNGAVVKAVLRDAHMPEAQFTWQPLDAVTLPRALGPAGPMRPLVRRLHKRPKLLPMQNTNTRDDGWLLRGLEHGPIEQVTGPYVVSGGWWQRDVHREYHFAKTRRGECFWVYYDRHRRRWFLHGLVQ